MAKFQIDVGSWAQDIAKEFNIADKATIPIMKMALYEGADVMANAANFLIFIYLLVCCPVLLLL